MGLDWSESAWPTVIMAVCIGEITVGLIGAAVGLVIAWFLTWLSSNEGFVP